MTHPGPRDYLIVLAALMALLGATVLLAFVDLGHVATISIALSIAAAKAVLIATFFMHLRQGSVRMIAFACAGFVWLGLLIVLTMSDYATRNRPAELNFKGEPRKLLAPPSGF